MVDIKKKYIILGAVAVLAISFMSFTSAKTRLRKGWNFFKVNVVKVEEKLKKKKQATSIPAPSVTERLRDNSLSEDKDTKKLYPARKKSKNMVYQCLFTFRNKKKKKYSRVQTAFPIK